MSQAIITQDELKVELFKELKTVENYLGEKESLKFMSAVMYVFGANKTLADCNKTSIVQSFMKCAELNIYPSSVSGEAYILPYKGVAQFQLGYKGIVKLLSRSGIVVTVSDIVRKNDEIEILGGTNPWIFHKIPPNGDRGEAIGVYVVAKIMGETVFKYMSKTEVLAFKEFSQSKGSSYSPWNPSNDPELWMWRKTCLKQLSKTLPQNEQLAVAIAEDDKEADIKEYAQQQIKDKANRESSADLQAILGSATPKKEEVPPPTE